ncbi:response regulator [Planctomycetota bacterium]
MTAYTVLFVDDEQDFLHCLRRALAEGPYHCLFADSADKALAIMNAQPVHIVVADIHMPGMSGLELLADVTQHYPETVCILLSGQSSIEPCDISQMVQAVHKGEVFKFIAKSVELEATIREVLQEAVAYCEAKSPQGSASTG